MRIDRRGPSLDRARALSVFRDRQAALRLDRGGRPRPADDMSGDPAPRRFVLVTGMSGAGLSTTLKALEDLGYEVLDNLPLFLFDLLLREAESRDRPLAIGIDSRTRDFTADALLTRLNALRERAGIAVQLICVDADDDVLLRRFIET